MGRDPEVAAALGKGARLASVTLVRATGQLVKANLSINGGILSAIDADAAGQGLSRSAWIEAMARHALGTLT